MTYVHIPLDKIEDNQYFIYSNYNDEGGFRFGREPPFLRPKKD